VSRQPAPTSPPAEDPDAGIEIGGVEVEANGAHLVQTQVGDIVGQIDDADRSLGVAKSLLEKGVPAGTTGRIALPVAGDSSDAKATVLRLVDELGFDPVDGGDLDNSWRQQPGAPAYCRDLEADALRRALAEADRSRIAEYRAAREASFKREVASRDDESDKR
jgi:hypothetical protein